MRFQSVTAACEAYLMLPGAIAEQGAECAAGGGDSPGNRVTRRKQHSPITSVPPSRKRYNFLGFCSRLKVCLWKRSDVVRLVVVRHGATANNLAAQFTGQLDVPLSRAG